MVVIRRRYTYLRNVTSKAGGWLARGEFPHTGWGCIPSDAKALAVGTGCKVHVFNVKSMTTDAIFGERLLVQVFSSICDDSGCDSYYLGSTGFNPHLEKTSSSCLTDILLIYDGQGHFNALVPKGAYI